MRSQPLGRASGARSWAGVDRDERQRIRRDELLRAGVGLLGAVDYRSVNVRAVCRASGLTERYFYESFPDRDSFVVQVYQYVGDCARVALMAAVAQVDRPIDIATAAVAAFVELMVDDSAMGRVLLLAPSREQALGERGQKLFPEFVALVYEQLDEVADPVDKQLTATGLVGALTSLFTGYLNGTITVDRERFVRHCVDMLERANRRCRL